MISDFLGIFIFLFIFLWLPIIFIRWVFRVNDKCRYLKKIHDQLEKNSANHIRPNEKKPEKEILRQRIKTIKKKPISFKKRNGFFGVKCRFCGKTIEVPKEYIDKEICCSFCERAFLAKVSS